MKNKLFLIIIFIIIWQLPLFALEIKPFLYFQKGTFYYYINDFKKAEKKFLTAYKFQPNSIPILINLANTYHQQKNYFEAEKFYLISLNICKKPQQKKIILYNLGNNYFRQENYLSAVKAYQQALIITAKDQDIKFNLELALKKINQKQKSKNNTRNFNSSLAKEFQIDW